MWVVKKHKIGDKVEYIKKLSDDEVDAIFYVLLRGRGTNEQKSVARKTAQFIRDKGCWLQCDCKCPNPLMTIGLSVNGKYYIQHINTRSNHSPACRFKEVVRFYENAAAITKPCNKTLPLRLCRKGGVGASRDHELRLQQSATKSSYPRLAKLLFSLLEDAKINLITAPKVDVVAQYHAIQRVASMYKLEKEIKLSDCFWTFPNIGAGAVQLKKGLGMWPEGSRPHGVFVVVCEDVRDNEVVFKTGNNEVVEPVFGVIKASSGRLGAKSAPYLAIITMTNRDDTPSFELMDLFYIPVYSKHNLVPVDSNYERLVLKELLHWLVWWEKQGVKVKIKKPLFDIVLEQNEKEYHSKPDFLIETSKRRIVLEVMGSHEEEYIQRKQKTTKIMQMLGEVVEFDALAADKNNSWDESLKRTLKQISAIILS